MAPPPVHRLLRSRLVRACSVLTCFVITCCGAAPAAVGAPPPAAEQEARALYERAEKSFDVGKFAEALTDYQAAYEAKPLPGFLFNIAQCYRNMGNFERARFFFRRYLALAPRAPNRRKVEDLIAEMTKQLDEQKAAAAAAPTVVPPPAPEAPAQPAPLPSAPAPIVQPAPPVALPLVTRAAAPAPAPTARPVWRRWWLWTGVGAVVVSGAVAAFFLTRPKTSRPGTLDPIDWR